MSQKSKSYGRAVPREPDVAHLAAADVGPGVVRDVVNAVPLAVRAHEGAVEVQEAGNAVPLATPPERRSRRPPCLPRGAINRGRVRRAVVAVDGRFSNHTFPSLASSAPSSAGSAPAWSMLRTFFLVVRYLSSTFSGESGGLRAAVAARRL